MTRSYFIYIFFLIPLFLPMSIDALAVIPPIFSLTSLLFPVRDAQVLTYSELAQSDAIFSYKTELAKAADFFVDAFWTAKVGGGADQLTKLQERDLKSRQLAEFQKRYGQGRLNTKAQFFVLQKAPEEILACAGIELDTIRAEGIHSPQILERQAPLMSNLAVSRRYRRRGLAEQLVKAVEEFVLEQWPDQDSIYLLVEARNKGAVKLYEKLGYQMLWADDSAETLLPRSNGQLAMVPTTVLCMKKDLRRRCGKNPFANLFL